MAFLRNQSLRRKERFSLLLLEPGEIYFEDFSAFLYLLKNARSDSRTDPTTESWVKGRFKICSKSVIFDPADFKHPILKFLYRDGVKVLKGIDEDLKRCDLLFDCDPSSSNTLILHAKQAIQMKEQNHIQPYNFIDCLRYYVCVLEYRLVEDCLPHIEQLQRAATLPAAEQQAMVNAIVQHKQHLLRFNPTWIENPVEEKRVHECYCNKVAPLVINPGRLILTTINLYYQPFNNIDPEPYKKIKLRNISSVIKRRFLLQQIGLELTFRQNSPASHLYLTFSRQEKRDEVYNTLMAQPLLQCDDLGQENMTLKWRNKAVSNYDYLLYLNSIAERSINDLTQYPVFPWVVQDYTSKELDLSNPETFRDLSKPIGALNPERLEKLKARYAEMSEPRFLYGSHYSTPGYVLFYLVRAVPEYMLCLQNGRFDQPDRMFNSLIEAWKNCLNSYSDYKELIPEFFEGDGQFLVNALEIDFGLRHDGTTIGDIRLPPWASDHLDFISKMRSALESDYVSDHLHEWIDLIFGYKNQGETAENSYNLFYYLTYEGAVDLKSLKDMNERIALEQQIMEFGQTPRQLFSSPHPPRSSLINFAKKETKVLASSCDCKSRNVDLNDDSEQTCLQTCKCSSETADGVDGFDLLDQDVPAENDVADDHKDCLNCVHTPKTPKGRVVWSEATSLRLLSSHNSHKGAISKVFYSSHDEDCVHSIGHDGYLKMFKWSTEEQVVGPKISHISLSCCAFYEEPDLLFVGCWNNTLYLYSISSGMVLEEWRLHDDAISCLWLSKDKDKLVTASWDSTVRLYRIVPSGAKHKLLGTFEGDHDTGVNCICVKSDCSLVLTGQKDGRMTQWELGMFAQPLHFGHHQASVCHMQLSQDEQRLLSTSLDNVLLLTDLSDGTTILQQTFDQIPRCFEWLVDVVVIGTEEGYVQVWRLGPGGLERQCASQVHEGAVLSVCVNTRGCITSGGADGAVHLTKALTINRKNLRTFDFNTSHD